MATAAFYQTIVEMTPADKDQDHIETIIFSRPNTPSRIDYILGESGDNPAIWLHDGAKKLEQWGADLIAMPCVTAHYFKDSICEDIKIPFIDMIDETILELKRRNIDCVGIVGSSGTVLAGHLQKRLQDSRIKVVIPKKEIQAQIDIVIFEKVKKGNITSVSEVRSVADQLFTFGAQVNLLACTELSVIAKQYDFGNRYIDMMAVLANSIVERYHNK